MRDPLPPVDWFAIRDGPLTDGLGVLQAALQIIPAGSVVEDGILPVVGR